MLRYTLTSLRRALADHTASPHLGVEGYTVGLDVTSGIDIDLDMLRQHHNTLAELDRAACLWRGEFLEGFALADAPDFDEWVSFQREGWREKMERILDRLSQLRTNRGELAESIDVAQRWVALSPLNEEAHRA